MEAVKIELKYDIEDILRMQDIDDLDDLRRMYFSVMDTASAAHIAATGDDLEYPEVKRLQGIIARSKALQDAINDRIKRLDAQWQRINYNFRKDAQEMLPPDVYHKIYASALLDRKEKRRRQGEA